MKEPETDFWKQVEPHLSLLYRFAYRLSGSSADAEDLVQDCLHRAYLNKGYKNSHKISESPGGTGKEFADVESVGVASPKAWLLTILRNEYLQKVRKKKGLTVSLDSLTEASGLTPAANPDTDDSTALEEWWFSDSAEEGALRIDLELLQNALNQLPEGYRTPLILYFFQEFGYKEIAEVVGVPIGTVMSRLSRAKKSLKELLCQLARESSRS